MLQVVSYGIKVNNFFKKACVFQIKTLKCLCKYNWYILNKVTWFLFYKKCDFNYWADIRNGLCAFLFGGCIGAYQLYRSDVYSELEY